MCEHMSNHTITEYIPMCDVWPLVSSICILSLINEVISACISVCIHLIYSTHAGKSRKCGVRFAFGWANVFADAGVTAGSVLVKLIQQCRCTACVRAWYLLSMNRALSLDGKSSQFICFLSCSLAACSGRQHLNWDLVISCRDWRVETQVRWLSVCSFGFVSGWR